MELWERSVALAQLERHLRDSANAGRVVLVAGEAGIGKTAFVAEFVRRAGAGARVLWGGCDQLVTPRALGPLHDMARRSGGRLAAQLSADVSQEEIFGAFLEELSGPRLALLVRPPVDLEEPVGCVRRGLGARHWGERARDVGARHGNLAAELQGANTLEAVRRPGPAPRSSTCSPTTCPSRSRS